MKHIWLYLSNGDIETERRQCVEEGRDIESLADEFERVAALDLEYPANQPEAERLLDKTIALPQRSDYSYDEPSDLDGILAARPSGSGDAPSVRLSDADLEDRVYGAWTGRCVGCLLGKPVEGWRRARMWGYLKDAGRWPLTDFFRYDAASDEVRQRYDIRPDRPYGDLVSFMPEDDDTNYTTTGLAIMERYGPEFTPDDVANFWMSDIPLLHTCTAERVAYRNFALLIGPPASASYRNPYREWIGAQIRADFWGYAAPGQPELAARFAWCDACISHVKNGIYGEMWAAAMVAAAFTTSNVEAIVRTGLAQVPANCRLAEAVRRVLGWYGEGKSYDEAVELIHREWNEEVGHDWCHTISNAMVVTVGLLWGEGDFARSICRAVQPCFDTDCNGATVGSIMGAALGRKALPATWADHIHDTLHTGVAGYHEVKLRDITQATLKQIERVANG
jgi:hypothetical protein